MTPDITPTVTPNGTRSASRDFDFLIGRWTVQHRRLLRRLAGCTEWQSFAGTCEAVSILGGDGNVDDNLIALPEGSYRAATLRSFDRSKQQWSIWWLDTRHAGALDTPMRGAFVEGQGLFLADDHFEGRPIRVRFLWTRVNTPQPRWEQAFSADGGITWEDNWTMDFTRCA